jgi:hypothetical protein
MSLVSSCCGYAWFIIYVLICPETFFSWKEYPKITCLLPIRFLWTALRIAPNRVGLSWVCQFIHMCLWVTMMTKAAHYYIRWWTLFVATGYIRLVLSDSKHFILILNIFLVLVPEWSSIKLKVKFTGNRNQYSGSPQKSDLLTFFFKNWYKYHPSVTLKCKFAKLEIIASVNEQSYFSLIYILLQNRC